MCGRIAAYPFGGPQAFRSFNADPSTTFNEQYVDGVVLSYGSLANHIWTFAAGVSEDLNSLNSDRGFCNCDLATNNQNSIPDFIGNDYFCESQNGVFDGTNINIFPNEILWDGEDCLSTSNCCEFNRPPYFIKDLGYSVSENIEARICLCQQANNADIAVEVVELYVHE